MTSLSLLYLLISSHQYLRSVFEWFISYFLIFKNFNGSLVKNSEWKKRSICNDLNKSMNDRIEHIERCKKAFFVYTCKKHKNKIYLHTRPYEWLLIIDLSHMLYTCCCGTSQQSCYTRKSDNIWNITVIFVSWVVGVFFHHS